MKKFTTLVLILFIFFTSCKKNEDFPSKLSQNDRLLKALDQDSSKIVTLRVSAKKRIEKDAATKLARSSQNLSRLAGSRSSVKYALYCIMENYEYGGSIWTVSESAKYVEDLLASDLMMEILRSEVMMEFAIEISDLELETVITIGQFVDLIYDILSEGEQGQWPSEDPIDYNGKTQQEATDAALSITSVPSARDITVTSPTSVTMPISWVVVSNLTNTWQVTSYDEVVGYRLPSNIPVMYSITHTSSSIGGETYIDWTARGSVIPIPISNISWSETSYSTNIAPGYQSGSITVTGNVKNFGISYSTPVNTYTVNLK